MSVFELSILVVCGLGVAFCITTLFRNEVVNEARKRYIDFAFQQQDWRTYVKVLDSVSYDSQLRNWRLWSQGQHLAHLMNRAGK